MIRVLLLVWAAVSASAIRLGGDPKTWSPTQTNSSSFFKAFGDPVKVCQFLRACPAPPVL
jgi:hypothetical protein